MKKILCALLALGMTFAAVACGGKGGNGNSGSAKESSPEISSSVEDSKESSAQESESEEESSEDSWEEFIPDYTGSPELTEYFDGLCGEVTYNTGKNLTVTTIMKDEPIYIGDYDESNVFTVDGGVDFGRTLTATGRGAGVIQIDGGILILKNLTILSDEEKTYSSNGYKDQYVQFGGKIRFENCTLRCSVQLMDDADAEFVNCEIYSVASDLYSVWVSEGKAKFSGCTFRGHRALKLYEQDTYGRDVKSVVVENCVFENLIKKPGIAIDIETEYSTTSVSFVGCEFNNCAEWTKDSFEGVDGFYESDNDTTTFDFSATNCYIDGMLFDFVDGELIEAA